MLRALKNLFFKAALFEKVIRNRGLRGEVRILPQPGLKILKNLCGDERQLLLARLVKGQPGAVFQFTGGAVAARQFVGNGVAQMARKRVSKRRGRCGGVIARAIMRMPPRSG